MRSDITIGHDQREEILKAVGGIRGLVKLLPSTPADAGTLYAIRSNLSAILSTLGGIPRVTPN